MKSLAKRVHLSDSGKVAMLISMALCTSPVWADIRPSGDTNTAVEVNGSGTEIVNIASPNAQGLSHNKYGQFDVSGDGAVLNNSLKAGKSILAGQLDANSHFSGKAATIILNEVVGDKASELKGQQEIFGMSADYVLANPKGITCNGCGFINTSRASLVVGKPEVEAGNIKSFAVGTDGNENALNVRGQVSGVPVLDLIAPRVDVNGDISTEGSINVLMGRAHVDYKTLEQSGLTPEELKANEEVGTSVLDGSIVGSMTAGRIRIHSTDAGGSVKVQGTLEASKKLDADVAGNLIVSGKLEEDNESASTHSYNWRTVVTLDGSAARHNETFTASRLAGGDISLKAGKKAKLSAVQVEAKSLEVEADEVSVTDVLTSDISSDFYRKRKFLWYRQIKTDTKTQTSHGNNWQVEDGVSLKSTGGDVRIRNAQIRAGNVSIAGANNVIVDGQVTTNTTSEKQRYENETVRLRSGGDTDFHSEQNYVATQIEAGESVSIGAGGDVDLLGVGIKTEGKAYIHAGGKVTVGAQSTQTEDLKDKHFVFGSGIAGGETHVVSKDSTTQHVSSIESGSITLSGNKGIKLEGAKLDSSGYTTLLSNKGDVVVDYLTNQQNQATNDRHGTAFNITDENHKTRTTSSQVVASNISSTGVVISGQRVNLIGSTIKGPEIFIIKAVKSFDTDIAQAENSNWSEDYTLGFKGYAHQDGSAIQGIAGARLQGVTHTVGSTEADNSSTGTILFGNSIEISSEGDINLKGTKIDSVYTDMAANNISIAAGDLKAASTQDIHKVSGGGIYVSGGLEKIAIGFEAGTDQTHHKTETHKGIVSSIEASDGYVSLTATGSLENQGTVINSSKIDISAADVSNKAAADTFTDHIVHGQGGVVLEIYAKPNPSVGAGLYFSGKGDGTKTVKTTALVSKLNGMNGISVTGTDSVTDYGTNYLSGGDITINSAKYAGLAAENTEVAVANIGNARIGLDVFTGDFQTVSAKISANTGYQHVVEGKGQAVLGNLKGRDITIKADHLESAMNIDASRLVSLTGTDVAITQANNRQWKLIGGFELGGSVGATFIPEAAGVGVAPSFSINAGVNYLKADNYQGVAATVKGKSIQLDAARMARVEGANVQAVNDFTMTGKTAEFDALYDSHKALGVDLSGSLSLDLSITGGGEVTGGGAGIGGNFALINEKSTTAHGGSIQAKTVKILADDAERDLLVSGTDINATDVILNNKSGNVAITAARTDIYKGNWGLGGELGASANKSGLTGFNIGGNLDIDTDNSHYYKMGQITADTLSINAGKDLTLQTDITAKKLDAEVGGNLDIKAAQDRTMVFEFGIGAHIGGSPVIFNEETTAKDVIIALNNDFQGGTIFGMKADGRLKFNVDDEKHTQMSNINVDEMNVHVGGNQVTVNASNVSSKSGTGFGGAEVTTSDNTDYKHDLGMFFEAKTPSIKQMLTDLVNGKKIESPFKAGSHKTWVADHTVSANVDVK